MHEADGECSHLKELVKEYGGVDSYTTTQAATIMEELFGIVKRLGLKPEDRADFFEGICRIFNLQLVNMQDYSHGKYIFAPNHLSEFDGVLFGTIVPNMLVVAKSDWVTNPLLNSYIEKLFSIVAVIRKDNSSGMGVLRKCIEHLEESADSAVTVFVQQTIADIDITTPEDIASGVCFIAQKSDAQIIPVYCEQVSTDKPTRIVFGNPLNCSDRNEFGDAWLKSEILLRDSISDPAARPPVLCEKHQKAISQREFQA